MTDKFNVQKWIKNNRYGVGYGTEVFYLWDEAIWKKSYEDIVEYLTKRLETTSDEVEYYYCFLYLEKHLPEKLRYLPYKESDQYKRSIGIAVDNNKVSKVQSKVKTFSTFSMFRGKKCQ